MNYTDRFMELVAEFKKRTDIPHHIRLGALAQAILESGRGQSGLAMAHNNFFGIKMRKELASIAIGVNYKAHDGKDEYAKFKTIEDAVEGYWKFINRKPYEGFEKAQNALEYVRFLHRAGYAEGKDYVTKIEKIIPEASSLLGGAVPDVTDISTGETKPQVGSDQAPKESQEDEGSAEPGERETPNIDEVLSPVVVLLIGHEKKAGGASFKHSAFKNEYQYNTVLCELAHDYAQEKYPNMKVHLIFRDGKGRTKALEEAAKLHPDAVIEFHFNAHNGKAMGSETLCSIEQKDREFSEIIHTAICKIFGRGGKSRGVKAIPRSARGGTNVYLLPGYANCLVEPFFGDNPTEAELAVKVQKQYAQGVIDAIYQWCQKVNLA